MNKAISILLGLVLLVAAIYAWAMNLANFGESALMFLKGGLIWMILFIGLILVILGISGLND